MVDHLERVRVTIVEQRVQKCHTHALKISCTTLKCDETKQRADDSHVLKWVLRRGPNVEPLKLASIVMELIKPCNGPSQCDGGLVIIIGTRSFQFATRPVDSLLRCTWNRQLWQGVSLIQLIVPFYILLP